MFSGPKLLVLIAILGIVFGVLALAGRRERRVEDRRARKAEARKAKAAGGRDADRVTDLTACPACGAYTSRRCERVDCPM